jgi:flagellar hook assembly protein FlgD
VSLAVYDVSGRTVRQLERGVSAAGQHTVTWDLRNENGQPVSRGVYFLRLAVDGQVFTQHVTVVH